MILNLCSNLQWISSAFSSCTRPYRAPAPKPTKVAVAKIKPCTANGFLFRVPVSLTSKCISDINKKHDPLFGCKLGWRSNSEVHVRPTPSPENLETDYWKVRISRPPFLSIFHISSFWTLFEKISDPQPPLRSPYSVRRSADRRLIISPVCCTTILLTQICKIHVYVPGYGLSEAMGLVS